MGLKGDFRRNFFGSVKLERGAFSWWVRFVWAGVNAVSLTLLWTKQPDRKCLKRWVSDYEFMIADIVAWFQAPRH